ncbi:hypothetical protein GC176_08530 [bacterium]|nr:hypothetical protein [bacterium]
MLRLLVAVSALLTLLSAAPGCAVVDVGVRNPVPGLETVAVAPFFNLSQERTVDGREFALAYYSELQKVPGFEVLPVGVAERAMLENGLAMQDPADALQLARILGVDAVVIGAVTDYDPYSPRVGLKVAWYSPKQWLFLPNSPAEKFHLSATTETMVTPSKAFSAPVLLRAQSPEPTALIPEIDEGNWETIGTSTTSSASDEIPAEAEFLPPRRVKLDAAAQLAVSLPAPQQEASVPDPRSIPAASTTPEKPTASRWTQSSPAGAAVPVRTAQLPQAQLPQSRAALSNNQPATASPPAASSSPAALRRTSTSPSRPDASGAVEARLKKVSLPSETTPPTQSSGTVSVPQAGSLSAQQLAQSISANPVTPLFPPPRDEDSVASAQESTQTLLRDQTIPALVFDDHVVLGRDEWDPRDPLMAYVRMFDSTDARLVARLADYLELSGETRSGDLEAYMKRSDFFRKFTAHVMISEMLLLHGGESRRRFLLKQRRYQ